MEFAYNIGGGAPHVKKMIVDEAAAISQGVPLQANADAANGDGVIAATTTVCIGSPGVSLDAADASTAAQVAAGAGNLEDGNNASFVSVAINGDAVYRAKFSGSGTEDTAITTITQAAADATGLAPTTATDEFMIWGYTGANAGHIRRADAANSVLIAFPNDIAAGDTFLQANCVIADPTQGPELSALFTQINGAGAVAASDNFIVVEHQFRDAANDGNTNSFGYVKPASHAFIQSGVLDT